MSDQTMAGSSGQWDPYPEPMLPVIGIVIVLAVALAIRFGRESPRSIPLIMIVAPIALIVFLLPFVLWAQGAIPFYNTAAAYAVGLALAMLIAGKQFLERQKIETPNVAES